MTDNSQKPPTPNYVPSAGRLVTDRYDFQNHVTGSDFRHIASNIDLSPPIVIGGVTHTTTQDAIQTLSQTISPSAPPLATTTAPGLIQLSGDLSGTNTSGTSPIVSGLQGRPVQNTAPSSGQVLTWMGTYWAPNNSGGFIAAGDLSGNNISQQVISLTGDTTTNPGYHTVKSSADYIQFISTAIPNITQGPSSTTAANLTISAQSVNSGSANAGELILLGGGAITPATGLPGAVSLCLVNSESTTRIIQATEVVSGQLVAAIFPGASGLTSTDMPANSGNKVIYIGNAGTAPTTPSPHGSILYSSGGTLNIMQSNGVSFTISAPLSTAGGDLSGSYPNPAVAKLQGIPVSSTAPTSNQVLEFNGSSWAPASIASVNNARAYYGTGADGSVVFDGTTTILGMVPNASKIYTFQRSFSFVNATINSGVTVATDGYSIMCTGTLTVNGILDHSGSDADGYSPGAGAPWGTVGGGSNGGDGNIGESGQAFANGCIGLGGLGGAGAFGSATLNNNSAIIASCLTLSQWLMSGMIVTQNAGAAPLATMAGGGSGGSSGAIHGGTSSTPGGGGGGGGGVLLICANILGGSGILQAKGGAGGPSTYYGGSGGGGGIIVIIYSTNSAWTGTMSVSGGAIGTGGSGNGQVGANGYIVTYQG